MTATDKALKLIHDKEIKYSRDFAKLMWPESPYWKVVYNVGNGATKGAGMWRSGGSFLGRLHSAGLIYQFLPGERIRLTDKGKARIADIPERTSNRKEMEK
jgi:hypothetical protein